MTWPASYVFTDSQLVSLLVYTQPFIPNSLHTSSTIKPFNYTTNEFTSPIMTQSSKKIFTETYFKKFTFTLIKFKASDKSLPKDAKTNNYILKKEHLNSLMKAPKSIVKLNKLNNFM